MACKNGGKINPAKTAARERERVPKARIDNKGSQKVLSFTKQSTPKRSLSANPLKSVSGIFRQKQSKPRHIRKLQPFRYRDKSVYDKEDSKVYSSKPDKSNEVPPAAHSAPQLGPAAQIARAFKQIEKRLLDDKYLALLHLKPDDLKQRFASFKKRTLDDFDAPEHQNSWITVRLKKSCKAKDIPLGSSSSRIEEELRHAFYGELVLQRCRADTKANDQFVDLRYPPEWYPEALRMKRQIHLHVGPTNSGKTYQALQRLQQSKSGIYAGPLRLLAHEIYTRLNGLGKPCCLITGDERREAGNNVEDNLSTSETPMISCTVEMVPQNIEVDVAVIDEIQMLGSEDRGWAWTEALLGVRAREVHLCGEERTVDIVKEIAALCGDELHVHRYERLNPLKMMANSLNGDLRNLQKGDCIVTFSIVMIHGLRQIIEKTLNKKVAIIYGSLPPETRADQARLFNDPNNDYDILVASNAVGMGLNLNIKRMIFQTAIKVIGGQVEPVPIHEIKQIAGRAGRFSTVDRDIDQASSIKNVSTSPDPPPKQIGLVTTLERMDYRKVSNALEQDAEPILSAGIFPPYFILARFAKHFPPETPLSHIMMRLCEYVNRHSRFFLCDLRKFLSIADAIHPVPGLSLESKVLFCSAPIEPRKPGEVEVAQACARAVAAVEPLSILDLDGIHLELLEDNILPSREYLRGLEQLHKALLVVMWLSYRFENIFTQRHLTQHVKKLVEDKIAKVLALLSIDYEKMRKGREQAILDLMSSEQTADKNASQPSDIDVSEPGSAVDDEGGKQHAFASSNA